jgi:hypothetical protein
MTKKQLIKIDKALDVDLIKDKILIKKRGYFIYYNDPNKSTKEIKVHTHTCGFCAWGSGNGRTSKKAGKNGVWIGPFENPKQAKIFAKEIIKPIKVSYHKCITKSKKRKKK